MLIRHILRGRPRLRGITSRRLAAARRALNRERDRLALFAAEVAAMQPSPEERIEYYDLRVMTADQALRDLEAKHWRWGRRQLERFPEHTDEILARWNRSFAPADGTYFADFVRTRLKRLGIEIESSAKRILRSLKIPSHG